MIIKENKLTKNRKHASALVKDQRRKRNKHEIMVHDILTEIGVNFVWQKPFSTSERFCVADFYLKDYGLVIEVDGRSHKKNKDESRTKWLYKMGVQKVFRINNQDLKDQEKVKQRVLNVISYLK